MEWGGREPEVSPVAGAEAQSFLYTQKTNLDQNQVLFPFWTIIFIFFATAHAIKYYLTKFHVDIDHINMYPEGKTSLEIYLKIAFSNFKKLAPLSSAKSNRPTREPFNSNSHLFWNKYSELVITPYKTQVEGQNILYLSGRCCFDVRKRNISWSGSFAFTSRRETQSSPRPLSTPVLTLTD